MYAHYVTGCLGGKATACKSCRWHSLAIHSFMCQRITLAWAARPTSCQRVWGCRHNPKGALYQAQGMLTEAIVCPEFFSERMTENEKRTAKTKCQFSSWEDLHPTPTYTLPASEALPRDILPSWESNPSVLPISTVTTYPRRSGQRV